MIEYIDRDGKPQKMWSLRDLPQLRKIWREKWKQEEEREKLAKEALNQEEEEDRAIGIT